MAVRHVLMIAPCGFCSNPETAGDNAFQQQGIIDPLAHQSAALAEFNAAVVRLESAGIRVSRFQPPDEQTPDALFPNNWFSTHEDGTLVLYPMKAVNRRLERRSEFIAWLQTNYPGTIDLRQFEQQGMFLEGTGSLVLDRMNRLAFSALSDRTHPALAERWAKQMGYRLFTFKTKDEQERPYYHTNVVLSVGEHWAIWCPDAMPFEPEKKELEHLLRQLGKEQITITRKQLSAFCANVLELENESGSKLLAVSSTAWDAFTPQQQHQLRRYCTPLIFEIPVIEKTGGGGIRCMLAELA